MPDLTGSFGQRLQRSFQHRLQRWLAKRQPAAAELRLNQRILFVFPTRYGFAILALALLLYLLGTNYQNNLILMQSFFLIILFIFSIVLSFQNLRGLTLHVGPPPTAFAAGNNLPGQVLHFCLPVTFAKSSTGDSIAGKKPQQIRVALGTDQRLWAELPPTLPLQLLAGKRGLHQLPRFLLSSEHPFGLVRCWCYPALQQPYWVYPSPIAATPVRTIDLQDGDLQWSHLSPYQPGDALQRLDWKRLARQSHQPVVKVFNTIKPEQQRLLILPPLQGQALEIALSDLCAQILHLTAAKQAFILQLPQQTIALGQGEDHQRRCLEALALC